MDFTESQLRRVAEHEEDEIHAPEPASVVAGLEKTLGVRFPDSLKKIWALGEEMILRSRGFGGQDVGGLLNALANPKYEYVSTTVLDAYRIIKEDYPKVIPIASHGNGDCLVLDYRFSSEPTVHTFRVELSGDSDPFVFAAFSFDELIDRGQEDREAFYQQQDQALDPDTLSQRIGFDSRVTFNELARQGLM